MKDLKIAISLANEDAKEEEKHSTDVSIITDNNHDNNSDNDEEDIEFASSILRGYTILEEDLSLPYKQDKCFSKFKYHLKSWIVTNPRLFSLYLLYKSMWPRALVIGMYSICTNFFQ